MSLSWPERIVVGLEPARLTALRVQRGWKSRVLERHDQLLSSPDHPWEQIIAALGHFASLPHWQKGRVDIVLSNHFSHYAVVPESHKLSREARQALARHVFMEKYGDLSRHWQIRLSPDRNGKRQMASAVARDLLEQLRSQLGKRLHSVRPALMCVFNQSLNAIGEEAGHLAMIESGRITLASLHDGQWQSILSRAVLSGDYDALPRLIGEVNLIDPLPTDSRVWLCDLGSQDAISSGSSWKAKYLHPRGALVENQKPTLACWGL